MKPSKQPVGRSNEEYPAGSTGLPAGRRRTVRSSIMSVTACIDHGCKGYGLGYATAWVFYDGRKRSTTRHRKVYYEATGDWPEVVRHKCDNPRCINPDHLEGGTQLDNVQDCIKRNRLGDSRNFGAANGRTLLTPGQVKLARALHIKGSKECGTAALARHFGISPSQMWRVVNNVHHTQVN